MLFLQSLLIGTILYSSIGWAISLVARISKFLYMGAAGHIVVSGYICAVCVQLWWLSIWLIIGYFMSVVVGSLTTYLFYRLFHRRKTIQVVDAMFVWICHMLLLESLVVVLFWTWTQFLNYEILSVQRWDVFLSWKRILILISVCILIWVSIWLSKPKISLYLDSIWENTELAAIYSVPVRKRQSVIIIVANAILSYIWIVLLFLYGVTPSVWLQYMLVWLIVAMIAEYRRKRSLLIWFICAIVYTLTSFYRTNKWFIVIIMLCSVAILLIKHTYPKFFNS